MRLIGVANLNTAEFGNHPARRRSFAWTYSATAQNQIRPEGFVNSAMTNEFFGFMTELPRVNWQIGSRNPSGFALPTS